MEKEKLIQIRDEIEKRYLENGELSPRSVSMYNIVNSKGENYSRYQGWRKRDRDIFGHLFDSKQLPVALEVLKENGYEDVRVVKDKTGTLFMRSLNSPFSHDNMWKTFLYTLFIMAALALAFKIAQTDLVLKFVEDFGPKL